MFAFSPPLASAAFDLWYALPLVVAISVVYSATRHEEPHEILVGAVRSAVWVVCFMGLIFAVLWCVGLLL